MQLFCFYTVNNITSFIFSSCLFKLDCDYDGIVNNLHSKVCSHEEKESFFLNKM